MATTREKPAELAVALRYDPDGPDLPRVAAKGRDAVAAQIVSIATAHGVAIRRDGDLAALLATLELDSPIPIAAFAAVAEILAHLYRADARIGEAAPS